MHFNLYIAFTNHYNAHGTLKSSAQNGGELSFKLRGREPDTHCTGGSIVPRANVDVMTVKGNVFISSRNQIHDQSLY
jgi:hypothetical protein